MVLDRSQRQKSRRYLQQRSRPVPWVLTAMMIAGNHLSPRQCTKYAAITTGEAAVTAATRVFSAAPFPDGTFLVSLTAIPIDYSVVEWPEKQKKAPGRLNRVTLLCRARKGYCRGTFRTQAETHENPPASRRRSPKRTVCVCFS